MALTGIFPAKQISRRRCRKSPSQVLKNGISYGWQHRNCKRLCRLLLDNVYRFSFPVNVAQPYCCNIARPHARIEQEHHDRTLQKGELIRIDAASYGFGLVLGEICHILPYVSESGDHVEYAPAVGTISVDCHACLKYNGQLFLIRVASDLSLIPAVRIKE